jgi:hypothetical protein
MQQATINTAADSASKIATVVLNDKSRVLLAQNDSEPVINKNSVTLLSLESIAAERKQWELGAYRTSNQQLYGILAQCYGYFLGMTKKDDEGKALRVQLNSFIEKHGLRFTKASHGITKVLKCVFFDGENSVDRRRISTYSIVLRSALAIKVAADQLAQYIEAAGGVQELRLAKSPNAKTAKQKAELGKECVFQNAILATTRSDEVTRKLVYTNYNKPLAAIVVVRSDGTIELRDVLNSNGAANAVLAAHYAAANDSKNQKAA